MIDDFTTGLLLLFNTNALNSKVAFLKKYYALAGAGAGKKEPPLVPSAKGDETTKYPLATGAAGGL
ncbi:MAG: hypothetical protein A3E79_09990 [Burkholderiales bacterium RIFCSPHIGHO2_12_FULL_61_11]|nr:MAG: hypothetical protein A3E79_09990 [Burkholderiales bacterium RIFCSPHIGHO2_12_FULL_61_11]